MHPLEPPQLTALRMKLRYCYFSDSSTGCDSSPILLPGCNAPEGLPGALPAVSRERLAQAPDWCSSFRWLFLKDTKISSQDREKRRKL